MKTDLKNLKVLFCRYKVNLIINTYLILTTALIITGGIFLLATALNIEPLPALLISIFSGLALMIYPVKIIARNFSRPRKDIMKCIEQLGEGRPAEPLNIEQEEIFVDIAESVNMAGEKLSDKLQSIIRNTNRLSQVEEELSSLFRPRNATDKYTRDLVCRLKICTSRLKNDLDDFCRDDKRKYEQVDR